MAIDKTTRATYNDLVCSRTVSNIGRKRQSPFEFSIIYQSKQYQTARKLKNVLYRRICAWYNVTVVFWKTRSVFLFVKQREISRSHAETGKCRSRIGSRGLTYSMP